MIFHLMHAFDSKLVRQWQWALWLIGGPHHPTNATTKWVGSSGAQPSSQEPTQDCGLGLNRFSTYILELRAATLEAPLIPSS